MADRVLVTGSCGSVGPFVVRELIGKGYEVLATDLPGAPRGGIDETGCDFKAADLLDLDRAKDLMKDVDAVIHTAARMNLYMTRPEYEAANYLVTVRACEAAVATGVGRFIHYSTADSYGPPLYTPVDEDHPQNPVGLYGVTKTFGEHAAMRFHRDHGLRVSVVRPSMVYGPANAYVMGILLGLAVIIRETGIETLPVPSGGFRANIVHAEDVAAASVFLLEKDEAVGQAFNVADDTTLAFGDLLEIIMGSVGVRCRRSMQLPSSLIAGVQRAASHLPRVFFSQCTRMLQDHWDHIVCRHRLRPLLKPRLDPGITTFGRGDYIFDTSKLKGLGYEVRYPDLAVGWNESVRWYAENEWIPAYEPVEPPAG